MVEHAARICQAFPEASPDTAIGQLLIDTLTPLAVEAALTIAAELQQRADYADRLRAAVVERAHYYADLTSRRRYLAVDPANRLGADTLEVDWNTALRAIQDARDAYGKTQNAAADLAEARKPASASWVTDFPAIWNDPATPQRERSA